jgi:hypothetical protein
MESRRRDEIVDLTVKMAAAAEAFPAWREAMLPLFGIRKLAAILGAGRELMSRGL